MKIVSESKKFRFKKLCPYCGGDMIFQATSFIKHPSKQFWKADSLEGDCVTAPDFESSDFYDWLYQHSYMPYVHMLPIQIKVEKYISENYRFKF